MCLDFILWTVRYKVGIHFIHFREYPITRESFHGGLVKAHTCWITLLGHHAVAHIHTAIPQLTAVIRVFQWHIDMNNIESSAFLGLTDTAHVNIVTGAAHNMIVAHPYNVRTFGYFFARHYGGPPHE